MKDSGLLDCKPELNRRRFGVYLGSGEGQQDFPRFVSLVHRSTRDGRVDTSEFTPDGSERAARGARGRAGAGNAVRPPGERVSEPGDSTPTA